MDLGWQDRVAVVTGGSSGIGLATVRLLLQEGARVAACARDEQRLAAVRDDLAQVGWGDDRFLAVACDVLDAGQVEGLREATLDRFGRVDALINNAGQARVSRFADTVDADWEAELQLKFFSIIRPVRAFLPALRASDTASITIVNSLLARQPEPHLVATSAARAGVQNLAKSMSVEFAPTVRVNTILIGTVNSNQWERRYHDEAPAGQSLEDWLTDLARDKQIPLGRMGRPDEAARAIGFLASPAAGFITGAALEVAGGVSRFA